MVVLMMAIIAALHHQGWQWSADVVVVIVMSPGSGWALPFDLPHMSHDGCLIYLLNNPMLL
jgi:hypothetical protein